MNLQKLRYTMPTSMAPMVGVCTLDCLAVYMRYVLSLKKRYSFLKTHETLGDDGVSALGKGGHGKGCGS